MSEIGIRFEFESSVGWIQKACATEIVLRPFHQLQTLPLDYVRQESTRHTWSENIYKTKDQSIHQYVYATLNRQVKRPPNRSLACPLTSRLKTKQEAVAASAHSNVHQNGLPRTQQTKSDPQQKKLPQKTSRFLTARTRHSRLVFPPYFYLRPEVTSRCILPEVW